MNLELARRRLFDEGAVVLPAHHLPLRPGDLARVAQVSADAPTERVQVGDMGETHALEVGRLKVDVPEPAHVSEGSRELEALLLSPEMRRFLGRFVGRETLTLRRLQVNRIGEGGFIGDHVDLDSDPRRQVAMVFHLPCDYAGGAFVIRDAPGGERRFTPPQGSVMLSRGDLLHGVEPVQRRVRLTLAAFLYTGGPLDWAALAASP